MSTQVIERQPLLINSTIVETNPVTTLDPETEITDFIKGYANLSVQEVALTLPPKKVQLIDGADSARLIQQAAILINEQQPKQLQSHDPRVQVSWMIEFFYRFQEAFRDNANALVLSKSLTDIEQLLKKGWGITLPATLQPIERATHLLGILQKGIPSAVRFLVEERAAQACREFFLRQLAPKLQDDEVRPYFDDSLVEWREVIPPRFSFLRSEKVVNKTDSAIQAAWESFVAELANQLSEFDQDPTELFAAVREELEGLKLKRGISDDFEIATEKIEELYQKSSAIWELCNAATQRLLIAKFAPSMDALSREEQLNTGLVRTRLIELILDDAVSRELLMHSARAGYTAAAAARKEKDPITFEETFDRYEKLLALYPSAQDFLEEARYFVHPVSPFTEEPAVTLTLFHEVSLRLDNLEREAAQYFHDYVPFDEDAEAIDDDFLEPQHAKKLEKVVAAALADYQKYCTAAGGPDCYELLERFLAITEQRLAESDALATWRETVRIVRLFKSNSSTLGTSS